MNRQIRSWFLLFLGLVLASAGPVGTARDARKPQREEGEFRILVGGKDIGSERFDITSSGDTVVSSSLLDFRNPGETHQKIRIETRLEMNSRFVPTAYQLKSEVDGRKGTISGSFAPRQAIFEFTGGGVARKQGLLTGDQFTVLDSNVFHHFTFLARRLKYDGGDKIQRFEVIIPQEMEQGVLKVNRSSKEPMTVRGKKVQVHHVHLDSGSLRIEMWVDENLIVQKISVPSKEIEIFRAN